MRDTESGELVGLALWKSAAAAREAGPALIAAVEGDDFDTWFTEMNNRRLEEI